MRETEHRKQLLIQQIADHRERMRLEVRALQESNPVKPVMVGGRRLFGVLGAMRTGKSGAAASSHESGGASIEVELLRTILPVILPVIRALLQRHRERRGKNGT